MTDTATDEAPTALHPVPVDRISELYQGEMSNSETIAVARERIHWMCSQARGDVIADVGCSQGITAILLAREGMRVTGVDTHPDAIAYAIEATTKETPAVAARLTWIQQDIYELPASHQFDTIILGEVIEHQALPDRFLKAARSHLRPGGTIVLTTPFGVHPHDDHKVSLLPEDVVRMAEALGLGVTAFDVVDGYMRLSVTDERLPAFPDEDLLRVTAKATLESQTRLYQRLDRKDAQLVKRAADLRKQTSALTTLKAGSEQQAKALAQLERQVAETTRDLAEARAMAAQVKADLGRELGKAREAAVEAERSLQTALQAQAETERSLEKSLQAQAEAAQANATATALATRRAAERDDLALRLARCEAEAAEARSDARRQRRVAIMQQRSQHSTILAYERQAGATRQTVSFQLGEILVRGFKSPRNFLRMPGQLLALRRDHRSRRAARRDRPVPELGGKGYPRLLQCLASEGYDAAAAMIEALHLPGASRAGAYTALGHQLQGKQPLECAKAARLAYDADPQPWRAKWLAFRLHDAGELLEPARLLEELGDVTLSASEEARWSQIRAQADMFELKPELPFLSGPRHKPKAKSLLYVAASARPYHLSGYTMRTSALLGALKAARVNVTVATRPGYPWDRPDTNGSPKGATTVVDGITYHHIRQPAQGLPLDVYFERAAAALAKLATEQRVGAIQAASNHVNAVPALLAARQTGLPFHYEVRGLWEMSRASNVSGFEQSERYRLGLDLEAFVAQNADRVYAISEPLAAFLAEEWHIPRERIAVLPNAIDRDTFAAIEATRPARFTIGYAGALVGYEGLDLLLDAVAQVRGTGRDVSLLLIGDGAARESLEAQAKALDIDGAVEFAGKMEPEVARQRLAGCSLACLPRRPDKVCELIPPIKLVEAMAIGIPLVVPDLGAFRSEAEDGVTARFFRAGDVDDLARAIAAVMDAPEEAAQMATTARERALAMRTWETSARQVAEDIERPRTMLAALAGSASAGAEAPYVSECRSGGPEAVIRLLARKAYKDQRTWAQQLLKVGKNLYEAELEGAEVALAREALAKDRSVGTLRNAFWAAQRGGDFQLACDLIRELECNPDVAADPEMHERVAKLRAAPAYHLSTLELVLKDQPLAYKPVENRVCYILHNSLPYSSGGYGTRSHGVATGLRAAGYDVVALTRPGFPIDIKHELDPLEVPAIDTVDGIAYHRILSPKRSGMALIDYVTQAADSLEQKFRELRPAFVMAASNHVTGLPALIAARRLGLPFIYEVRGLWEITRISREADFEKSAAFSVQRLLEAAVCNAADHVFTLTEPMREELAKRGVPIGKIDLLPNSCDPTRFSPRGRDNELAARLGIPQDVPVIGYIGTFVDYEGLEDLASACALLKQRGLAFRLLLVGNENASGQDRGPITEMIATISQEAGLTDWLIMPGRVPYEEVESYYSLLDICPFPRKPLPVCEMVSPMKPLEALAMEKAVVVSSVRALVEMIEDQQTGMVFEKGKPESLADVLETLINAPDLRERLGKTGRKWVEQQRTWAQMGRKFARTLKDAAIGPELETNQPTAGAEAVAAIKFGSLPTPSQAKTEAPVWWPTLPEAFRARSSVIPITEWTTSPPTLALRANYVEKFGEEEVARRMPAANWKRAEICVGRVPADLPILDIGSGLGEFVNLFCTTNPTTPLTSVDVKDYALWQDTTGRIERVYKSIFDLGPEHARDVVTCFEVIEHLPPEMLRDAVAKLRTLAKRKLLVSVPFMEPLPLYHGHFTRFDTTLLDELFPDATMTIFDKGSKNPDKILAWILCEIEMG